MPFDGAPLLEGPSLRVRLSYRCGIRINQLQRNPKGKGQLTNSSTACPVNAGFLGDDLAAIVYGSLSGEVCLN